jgi:hypothetical protein
MMEAICLELREATLLMRIAQLSSGRGAGDSAFGEARARESLAFVFDCLRVARLTGDCLKEDALTVGKVTGQEKNVPALARKKQDLVEYLLQETLPPS